MSSSDPLHDRVLALLDARTVPHLTRLIRRRRGISLTAAVGVGAGLWLGSWVFGLVYFFQGDPLNMMVINGMSMLVVFALPFFAIIPMILGRTLALNDLDGEKRAMMTLADVPRSVLRQAYVLAVLYRLRVVLVVSFGLLPLLLPGLIALVGIGASSMMQPTLDISLSDYLAAALVWTALMYGLWGLLPLGACVGAQNGIVNADRPFGAMVRMGGFLLFSMMLLLMLLAVLGPVISTPMDDIGAGPLSSAFAMTMVAMLIPYVALFAYVRVGK